MPWDVVHRGNDWLVVRQGTTHVVGRHPTRDLALQQQQALYANDPALQKDDMATGDTMTTADLGNPGQAPLTVEPNLRRRRVHKADTLHELRQAGSEWLVIERKTQALLSRHPDRGSAAAALDALTANYQPAQQLRQRPNTVEVAKTGAPKGLWVGLQVPHDAGQALVIQGGEAVADLHLTLAMMPYPGQDAWQHLLDAMRMIAQRYPPVMGTIGGAGRFEQPDGGVVYAIYDSPDLLALRGAVLEQIRQLGGPAPFTDHGFVPHITLAYTKDPQPPVPAVPNLPFAFPAITVSDGMTDRAFALCGTESYQFTKAATMPIEELLDALRQDAESELEAIRLYSSHLDAIDDPEVKAEIGGIIADEKSHYGIFNRLIDKLDPQPASELDEALGLEKARTRKDGKFYDNRVHGRSGIKAMVPAYQPLIMAAQTLTEMCQAALNAGQMQIEWAGQVLTVEDYCRPLLSKANPQQAAADFIKATARVQVPPDFAGSPASGPQAYPEPQTTRRRTRMPIPKPRHAVGDGLPDSANAVVPFASTMGQPAATSVATAKATAILDYTPMMKMDDVKRYTFTVVYLATDNESKPETDAHNEYITDDELYEARMQYVQAKTRTIFVQHGVIPALGFRRAGEWVDLVQWPLPVVTAFYLPGKPPVTRTIPANSIWLGVIWDPWIWPAVTSGKIRGFSLGGKGKREVPDN